MGIGTRPGDRPAGAHPAAGPDVAASSGGNGDRHSIHTIAEVHS
jgi:hypothetical protein